MGIFSEMDIELKSGTEETALDAAEDKDILAKAQERDDARQQAEGEAAKAVLEQLAQTESKAEAKKVAEASEAEKRKAHEEAEAKRKAEWEAKKKPVRKKSFSHGKMRLPWMMRLWLLLL